MIRFAATLFAFLLALPVWAADAPESGLKKIAAPFFAKHCVECHGPQQQNGDLRVDTLKIDYTNPGIMARWEEIMGRVNSGDMPPDDQPRPHPESIAELSVWITAQLHEAEIVMQQQRSTGVAWRKLTRKEYANTIRDLLGVTYDATDPTGLPEDPDWHGFERIGSVLTLSPAHVEKYLAAAEGALDEALSLGPKPEQSVIEMTPFNTRWNQNLKRKYEARGIADQVRLDIIPNNHKSDSWRLKIPETGNYRVEVQLSGLRARNGRAPRFKLYLPKIDRTIFAQDVEAPEDKPITLKTVAHLPAGEYRMRVINAVPGPSPGARRSRHGPGNTAFTGFSSRKPWQLKLTDDEYRPIEPTLLIDSITWTGPVFESWPTPAHQQIFFRGEEAEPNSEYAREILSRFATRAWRRPVRGSEVDRLMGLFETSRQLGKDFPHAIRTALLAVLCSKSFLYLEEGSTGQQKAARLSDWQIASRLSYFLWSTMPDERLFDLAREGRLSDPQVRRDEVRRMLADPRAAAFAESFPRQWLQLRRVGMFPPDEELYPSYDEYLEQSMIAETVSYFGEVLHNNLSVQEFLDSDWTMLNERLATHYGIEGVRGESMRRVKLDPTHHRGGILTQAAILGLTSDGTRHRPVHRGVWMLESILGQPPPPPPANVPPLEAPSNDTEKLTVRQRLELHRENPKCASCHRRIDPLGIAFDNYDAIGRYRTIEKLNIGTGQDPTLDPSGELIDGRQFEDADELKHLLTEDLDRFAAVVTEKLATYALRRGMSFADRPELRRITEAAKADQYRLASLVEHLVASKLFELR